MPPRPSTPTVAGRSSRVLIEGPIEDARFDEAADAARRSNPPRRLRRLGETASSPD